MIRSRFQPQLTEVFAAALGTNPSEETWRLELDREDPEAQTLLFLYPAGIGERDSSLARYLLPIVKLELGARGEQWPAAQASIESYAAQAVPKPFKNPSCEVKVLAPERTFWEKATILHACYHRPSEKVLPQRQSRHYYDVMKLYEKGIGEKALGNMALLKSVAEHKAIFFRSAAAKYDEATPGSLRLVTPPYRKKELEADYAKMREMIFGEPPPLDDVLAVIAKIEQRVNSSG
ncbi:MAG: nucleotidyl transferase AbiEii/AbiGii toxin family protein [Elusimicrobiota bacterium]